MLRGVDRHGETRRERKVHLRLALLTAFGRDDDDAVGTLGAEHGRRRSVFQDRDVGHLVGVDGREIALHAVHQHQRVGVAEARHAADQDFGVVLTRLSRGLERRDARELAREGVGDVRHARIHEGVALDLRDGAHDALLALHAVAHDHDIGNGRRILPQRHHILCLRGQRHLLGFITQVGDQQAALGGNLQRESTLRIGRRAGRRALDDDVGSDHRRTGLIDHRTLNTVFRGGIPGLRRRSGRSKNLRRLQQTQRQNQHGEAQRAPSPGSGNCILCRFTHVDWFRLFVLC